MTINRIIRSIGGTVAIAAVSVFSQSTLDSSLSAYWPFEEGTRFSTNDESPNHFDIIGIQGVAHSHALPGLYGNFLSFDSVGCNTVVRESMGKFNSSNFTFAAFVQLQGPAKLQTIFQNSATVQGKNSVYQIQIAPNSTIQVAFCDTGKWTTFATPAKVAGICHIAVTYNGHYSQIFINGLLSSVTAPYNRIIGNLNNEPGPAVFGGSLIDGQYSNLFTGNIDEIRVYNRALGYDEIMALAHPKKDLTGCWSVEQTGPDKVYSGTMSLTQVSGLLSGTINWDSPYGGTTVTGRITADSFSIAGTWTSPSAVTVTYSGKVAAYGTVLYNASSIDNGGGKYYFHAVKQTCVVAPPQDTSSLCFTTIQEKSPGSGTWWTGTMRVKILSNGMVVGGTIDWDVPSHGTVTGGTISGNTALINTHNLTYNMDVTYSGSFTTEGNITAGTSNGAYAFDATKVSCQ